LRCRSSNRNAAAKHHHAEALQPAGGLLGYISAESFSDHCRRRAKAAQKYIDMGHLQVVAVGDAAKAREILAKYGKVELYDAEGKPVDCRKQRTTIK
jgi:hypothetical protein